jgi:hypothetical protein
VAASQQDLGRRKARAVRCGGAEVLGDSAMTSLNCLQSECELLPIDLVRHARLVNQIPLPHWALILQSCTVLA